MKMNLDGFYRSDNVSERIKLGREIVRNNPDFYSDKVRHEIYDSLEKKSGNTDSNALEDLFYHSIYCYWANGAITDEFFYYSFAEKSDQEIRKYITTREKLMYVKHLDSKDDLYILNDKYETYKKLPLYYKRDVICIYNEDDYPIFKQFVEAHQEFVVKPKNLGRARGVHYASVKDFSEEQIRLFFEDLLYEGMQNEKKYKESIDNSVVLEELIDEDPLLAQFHPGSVNALRITSVLVGDKVNIWRPWIKTGRGDNFVTAAFVGSPCAGIDVETGRINTHGRTENGEDFEKHPDSGVQFIGFQIPQWEGLVTMVKEMALQLPTLRYIGWDIVLSKKGWCVMEANDKAEFVHQFIWEEPMKDEFEQLIQWKLPDGFWWEN
ncbi:MAG: hypothetical protein IKP00_03750 [Victivallales bacterium]|nr:hypothetical protein [Victivallales bacterium]